MISYWLTLLMALPGSNDNFQKARIWFKQGLAAMDAGQTDVAIDAFRRSLDLRESPVTLFNLGVTCRKAEQWVCVSESLSRFLAITDAADSEHSMAKGWLIEAQAHLARVELHITGAPDRFEMDGAPRPERNGTETFTVIAGDHRFSVARLGFAPVVKEVHLPAGKTTVVHLDAAVSSRLEGLLHVEAQPRESTILLNGQHLGMGFYSQRLPTGTYTLAVHAKSHQSISRIVEVRADQETRLQLTLTPEEVSSDGLIQQWWFWTAVGAVVASAAIGTTVALTSTKAPATGNLDWVVRTRL